MSAMDKLGKLGRVVNCKPTDIFLALWKIPTLPLPYILPSGPIARLKL